MLRQLLPSSSIKKYKNMATGLIGETATSPTLALETNVRHIDGKRQQIATMYRELPPFLRPPSLHGYKGI